MSVKMLSMNTFHYLRGKLLDVWKLPSEFVTDSKYIEFNTDEIEVKALSTCFYFKPKFIYNRNYSVLIHIEDALTVEITKNLEVGGINNLKKYLIKILLVKSNLSGS